MAVAWTAILLAVSPLFGVDWTKTGNFDFRTTMYYHAIMLPLTGILILLVCLIMRVGGHVNTLLRYSLAPAIALCGVGSLFIRNINDLAPLWMQIIGFFVLDEMAIALLWGLIRLPKARKTKFTKMDISYWVILTTVTSAFIAALIGHGAGVGIDWGFNSFPGIPGYINSTGLDQPTFTANLMGSHSHEILPAVMGGIVALTLVQFGCCDLKGPRRWFTALGMGVMEIGVLTMTVVYVVSAVTSWGPPAWFASANGTNFIASDDILTGLIGVGAIVALVAMMTAPVEGRGKKTIPLIRDPLRLSLMMTWVYTLVSLAGFGYYIELNETYFHAAGLPNDEAFTRGHLMFGFFLMPVLAGALLALDLIYRRTEKAPYPQFVPPFALVGMTAMFIGDFVWIVTLNSVLFFIGFGLVVLTLALIAYYMYGVRNLPGAGTSCAETQPQTTLKA